MKKIEVTGKSYDEALLSGLSQIGLGLGQVTVELLDEGTKGFLGLGAKPVRLLLTERAEDDLFDLSLDATPPKQLPRKDAPKEQQADRAKTQAPRQEQPPQRQERPARQPHAQRAPRPVSEEAIGPAIEKAEEFLKSLVDLLELEVAFESRVEEGHIFIDMQGDNQGLLIGHRGETLDALQYLCSLAVNKGEEEYLRITLDTENYRAKREQTLINLASRMAQKVQRTGRRMAMEPMNPYERRIMHAALQGNEAVTTHSEGEEPNRRVIIAPKR
ncbi:MAG: protein jag [Christensenellaceae bacterium]|jgi:spoIIIJ-associated protein|nr:protein jag [Christensenellaceae bacterium]